MLSSTKTYTIQEFGRFARGGSPVPGYQILPERTFDALEEFILANNTKDDAAAADLLSLSARRGVGKCITAHNYVGLIAMKDGTVIEILPKIYGSHSEAQTKRIFFEMLRTLKDVKFQTCNVANLKTERLNLLDLFISMFVTEATTLMKQGLKSSYHPIEANERFMKGKLNISQDIRHNHVCRERFFVCYDEWNTNRPENRLILTTLRFLHKKTNSEQNRLQIARLITLFDGVEASTDYEADFSKCASDRSMSHYEKALSWCKVFLRGNSFTAYAGSEVAIALLFPMERIFECYIAARLRHHVPSEMNLRIQDTRFSLFDVPTKVFHLRPDIVLTNGEDSTVVMDTKWKILTNNVHNYGISQADMYQMYAYSKKYDAKKILLLYPKAEGLGSVDIAFNSVDGVQVEVAFIDLLVPDRSLAAIMDGVR